MSYKFSELSEMRLSGCHTDLILLAHQAIIDSPYDFKITEGHRSSQDQFARYKQGRELIKNEWKVIDRSKVVTNIDGIRIKGKHNYNPARAFDIMVLVNGKGTWEDSFYVEISKHILATANRLFESKQISHKVRWGGSFKNLYDCPHFELIF
jgi:hypothetical protein